MRFSVSDERTMPEPLGSHMIDRSGDKVIIRRLELFAGFDPTIDDGKDVEISKYDISKVTQIVGRTRQFIARQQHPRIVVLHSQENHSEPKEAVGAVLNVELDERNGVAFIVGDVEMSGADFDTYIASNKYPRRSAEIWSDDHMSEVALLGRDTPRRPLPDTRFAKQGDKVVFSMDCTSCTAVAPGAGNVFVPGANPKRKAAVMADEAKTEVGAEDMGKILASMQADIAKLKDENRKMYNELTGKSKCEVASEDEKAESDVEKEEMEEDEEKEEAKIEATRKGEKASFGREKARFERRIAALETELSKERFSRELDSMEADGYAVSCCREEMVAELSAAKDADRKIAFWRENFRRDPVGVRVMARAVSGLRSGTSEIIDRDTVAKLVAAADGDAEKFKSLMAKAKANG
jgi:Skp family chaperone for outer membrane proteins